jgi:archaemetzincin
MVKGEILLVPIGAVPPEVCGWLMDALPSVLGCTCRMAPAMPHPAFALNPRRAQYSADAILAQVDVGEARYALAIADLDLYVPQLNFVFGLADRAAARVIIALPRLRQSFYGLPDNLSLFCGRVVKEAVHELGHVQGLEHCHDRRCVMAFSNSLADTDYKGQEFCERCNKTRRV